MSTIHPKEVVTLTSIRHYEYITADPSSVVMPHARCLRTSHYKQDNGVPLLEPPNFIKGEAAASKSDIFRVYMFGRCQGVILECFECTKVVIVILGWLYKKH